MDIKGAHISYQYTFRVILIDIIKQMGIKTPNMLCIHLLACLFYVFLIILQEHLPTMHRGVALRMGKLQSTLQIMHACVKPPMNETQDANISLIYCKDVLCIYSAIKEKTIDVKELIIW